MDKKTKDRILSLFLYIISFGFLFERKLKYPSNVLPYIALFTLIGCATIILIRTFFHEEEARTENKNENVAKKSNTNRMLGLSIGAILYLILMQILGFYLSSLIFVGLSSYLLQKDTPKSTNKRILSSLIASMIVVLIVFILFKTILKVPTPKGLIL